MRGLLLLLGIVIVGGCSRDVAKMAELQRVRSGALQVALLSAHERLQHGRDTFVIEFRSADGNLIDVGEVHASATMPMPGAPMFGSIDVKRSDVQGRYRADGQFDMAGTWRITVQWQGQSGSESVTFSGVVQ